MKNFDIENFLVDLHKHVENINVSNPNTSVNSNATSLSSVFELALNKHAPLRPMSRREKRLSQKPWISKGILKSIKTKNKLFETHYSSNDPDKKLFYKQFLNKLTHIKSLTKRCYYENLIKENQGNSYRTWSIIGELIDYKSKKKNSKIPTTMDIEGHTYNTSSEAFLNKLCEYFANVGATITDAKSLNNLALTIHSKRCCQSFVLHEISEEGVNTCINNIKSQSAPGLDGISPKFIKLSKVVLTPFLTKLFNKCISQKSFPDSFKTAAIIPIPKSSSPNSMNDFRPISLLPIFSKIFEKIIAEKMTKFINKNNILSDSQFGFRTSSSTEMAVT